MIESCVPPDHVTLSHNQQTIHSSFSLLNLNHYHHESQFMSVGSHHTNTNVASQEALHLDGLPHHVTVDSERISRYTPDPGKWFFSFYLYTCTNNHDQSRRTRNEDRVSSCRVEHLVSVFYFLFTALIQSAVISDSRSSCRPSSLPLTTTTSFVLNNDWPG